MKVTYLETNKMTALELGFVKCLGWGVVDAWTTKGIEPIEVNSQYHITDKRFIEGDKDTFIKHYWL